jgi:hypothetical protein
MLAVTADSGVDRKSAFDTFGEQVIADGYYLERVTNQVVIFISKEGR